MDKFRKNIRESKEKEFTFEDLQDLQNESSKLEKMFPMPDLKELRKKSLLEDHAKQDCNSLKESLILSGFKSVHEIEKVNKLYENLEKNQQLIPIKSSSGVEFYKICKYDGEFYAVLCPEVKIFKVESKLEQIPKLDNKLPLGFPDVKNEQPIMQLIYQPKLNDFEDILK